MSSYDRVDALLREADEILGRTRRIVQRVRGPRKPTPHGFYDPAGFLAASRDHGEREALFRAIQLRIAAKVRARNERTNNAA